MSPVMVPASAAQALGMLQSALGYLADADAAGLPGGALAEPLRGLERADAVGAAARGRLLAAFDAADGHLADGQRTTRAWLVHPTRVTRGQAGEHNAVQMLARSHAPLLAGLAEGPVLTKSVALQLARWTRAIPAEYRDQAEEIVVAAARAGRACGRWPRSAPRSGPGPPRPIPRAATRAWTGPRPWRAPLRAPG